MMQLLPWCPNAVAEKSLMSKKTPVELTVISKRQSQISTLRAGHRSVQALPAIEAPVSRFWMVRSHGVSLFLGQKRSDVNRVHTFLGTRPTTGQSASSAIW